MTLPTDLVLTLRSARRIVVLTGAGVSAESGVPTLRDAQTGHWAKFKPKQLATPDAFRRHPRLVWEWHDQRREQVQTRSPNAGHFALAHHHLRGSSGVLLPTVVKEVWAP